MEVCLEVCSVQLRARKAEPLRRGYRRQDLDIVHLQATPAASRPAICMSQANWRSRPSASDSRSRKRFRPELGTVFALGDSVCSIPSIAGTDRAPRSAYYPIEPVQLRPYGRIICVAGLQASVVKLGALFAGMS